MLGNLGEEGGEIEGVVLDEYPAHPQPRRNIPLIPAMFTIGTD